MWTSTLGEVVCSPLTYPDNALVYVAGRTSLSPTDPSLIIPEDLGFDMMTHPEAVQRGMMYLVLVQTLHAIFENATAQKSCTSEDHWSAFAYYMENDAFIQWSE